MPWAIQANFDEDKTDVGLVVAIWTDPITTYGTFTFSKRLYVSIAERDNFIAEAIMARDAWQVRKANEESKRANILTALQTADPKD